MKKGMVKEDYNRTAVIKHLCEIAEKIKPGVEVPYSGIVGILKAYFDAHDPIISSILEKCSYQSVTLTSSVFDNPNSDKVA